jgi:hypothetical protein
MSKKQKKIKPPYIDKVYNNPRADNQYDGEDDNVEASVKDRMLFDETPRHKDTAKRMASTYQKRKRDKKIAKLRGNSSHWSGLENNENLRTLYNYIFEKAFRPAPHRSMTYRMFMCEAKRRELEKTYNDYA